MRIVCISDTHGRHAQVTVPEGDLLIHAGDVTARGSAPELEQVSAWLAGLPHAQKIVIAGNHDRICQQDPAWAHQILNTKTVRYLQDEEFVWKGLHVWGSPWTPEFQQWSFMGKRGKLAKIWAQIPHNVDMLITHGPPMGTLDINVAGWHVGCGGLADRLVDVQPTLHVFGHVHEAHGCREVRGSLAVNASVCNLGLQPVHAPQAFDWDGEDFSLVTTE